MATWRSVSRRLRAAQRLKAAFAQLSETGFLENFAQDLDLSRARIISAVQGPIAATLFGALTTAEVWKEKPTFYAVSRQDRMIAPELERFVANRANATTMNWI